MRVVSLDEELETEEGEMEREIPDDSLAPEQMSEVKSIQEAVQEAIKKLPSPYREVIILHDLQGFSYGEVANMLGTNEQAVRVRLHRARKRLKELLEPFIKE
ncbi:MAG: RNA polymerase sigma factor, partial [bacterium]